MNTNFALTALSLTLLFPAPAVFAADATVPTDFATVSEAVALAADTDGDGVVQILVLAGTYAENVRVTRSDLELAGEGAASTVIEGAAGFPAVEVRGATAVTVRGFTLTGAGTDPGLKLRDSGGCLVEDNVLAGNRVGIQLVASTANTVRNNEAHTSAGTGLKLIGSHDNTVTGNQIHDNLGKGMAVRNSGGNLIDTNLVLANGSHGIRVRRVTATPNTLSANTVADNAGNGFVLRDVAGTVVFGNTVTGNGANGLRMRDTADSLVSMNTATGNAFFGVRRRDPVNDDFDGATAGVQDPPGDNNLTGNGLGEVRND